MEGYTGHDCSAVPTAQPASRVPDTAQGTGGQEGAQALVLSAAHALGLLPGTTQSTGKAEGGVEMGAGPLCRALGKGCSHSPATHSKMLFAHHPRVSDSEALGQQLGGSGPGLPFSGKGSEGTLPFTTGPPQKQDWPLGLGEWRTRFPQWSGD